MRRSSAAWTSSAPRRVRVSSSTRSASAASRSGDIRPQIAAWSAEQDEVARYRSRRARTPRRPAIAQATHSQPTSVAESAACTAIRRLKPGGFAHAQRRPTCSATGIAKPNQTQTGQK